jgi:hypothetical protein
MFQRKIKKQQQDRMCRREFFREAESIEQQIKDVAMEEDPVEKEKMLIQILDQINSVTMIRKRNKRIGGVIYKAAMLLVVTLFGIFGLSMTSEANRIYMMHTIERFFNGDRVIILGVDEEQLSPNYSEAKVKKEAEKAIECTLPTFMYLPEELKFVDYEINKPIGSVHLKYQHEETVFSIFVYAAKENSSVLIQKGKGQKLFNREEVGEEKIEVVTYYVEDEDTLEYYATWEYENNYYELHSNLPGEEMKKVVKNIIF